MHYVVCTTSLPRCNPHCRLQLLLLLQLERSLHKRVRERVVRA